MNKRQSLHHSQSRVVCRNIFGLWLLKKIIFFYSPVYIGFRGLHEIDMDTKQAIIDLLDKKSLPGLASWKQAARRYGMREKEISFLTSAKSPAGAMLESLASLSPNITVYFICKTFKESGLRRMDVVNVLSRHVVTPMKSTR